MTESASPLNDDRLRFYLRHQDQIEEWAALGVEVRQATLEAFRSLGPYVEPIGVELGVHVRLDDAQGNYPRWILRRPDWPVVGSDPLAAVVLEAERANIAPASPSRAPYVGIRIGDPKQSGSDLLTALQPLAKQDDLKARGYRGGSGGYWPVFRRIPADPTWWESPDAWGLLLSTALREAWAELAPSIDEAVAGRP